MDTGCNRILKVAFTFLLVCIVCSAIFPSKVEANLLKFERKSSTKSPKLAAVLNLVPLFPKNSKKRPGISIYQSFQVYLDFIIAYSNFKKWDSIQLLFSKVEKALCTHFKLFLLKTSGIMSTCHDSSTFKYSPGGVIPNRNKLKLVVSKNEPLVVCHFMTALLVKSETVRVNPKLLIDYPAEIFVVASNFDNAENVIDEIQPENSVNYKWTLASRRNESSFEIEDIYGIVNSGVPIRNPTGSWSYDSGITFDFHKLLGPSDFQGRTLRITTFEAPPVVYARKSNGRLQSMGYLPDILEIISDELNFKYILSLPPDNTFGTQYDNGTWSGMVGVLQRKEAEMALMSFGYTPGRKEVMDFSPPIEYSSTRLLIRKDWQNSELKWKAYSEPFDWQVWLAIPWIIILGVSMFIVFTHYKIMQTTPSQSAWFLSACFLQQGLQEHDSIRKFPCRLVLGSFWILAVVLYASYTARLTSFLAATTDTLPINSLAEAVDNHHWKIGMIKGTSVIDRVKESNVPEMMRLWKRISIDSSGQVPGFREGLDRVYEDRYIFFTSDLVPSFLIKGNCTYSWIPGKYFPGFGYMGYAKNLPFKASLSIQVAKIRESGQMKRLFKKWWGADSSCSISNSNNGFAGMSLYETGTAFLLLICGSIFATGLLLVEFFIHLENPCDINTKINEDKPLPSPLSASSQSTHYSHAAQIEMEDNFPAANNTQDETKVSYQFNNIRNFLLRMSTTFRRHSQVKLQPGNSFSLKF
ncbi:unnamed protein product [Allacma fusca]|uniref:Uncharacterized protein n=1 Tax=Allacma fusca TaxID=39272 RepID=A0A8J2NVD8_9HEXA|nr:unnamed protein product [Allacma fusca]